MNHGALGSLKRIGLREVWESESGDFTPWLAQEGNIKLLGKTIGIELEVESQEKAVGPFSADILCKDTTDDSWVLIENQLERTDHTHLGQLMTYAAGLEAVSIIWIAERFTDEHRATLDWLNEVTEENINFFGLEIELWQIGDSSIAPKFNIVCKPNDWSKTVRSTAEKSELSDTRKLQLEYWTAFRQFMERNNSTVDCRSPRPQYWMDFAIGRSCFRLTAIVNTKGDQIRVYLCVFGPDKAAHYHLLENNYKSQIEAAIDLPLNWRELPDAKASQIETSISANPNDNSKWPEQHAWFKNTLELFHRVFSPIVKGLDASEYEMNHDPEAGEDA